MCIICAGTYGYNDLRRETAYGCAKSALTRRHAILFRASR